MILEQYVLILVKVLILSLLAVYTAFAFLITRKIELMTRAVKMKDEYLIRLLGLANFIFSIVVMIVALILL